MGKPHVFARQSNMYAGHDHSSAARSAGREGLEQPGRVLYVYDRVSTKDSMQWRMENTTLPGNGTDLSGVYKKKAHIHSDMERNLKQFYASGKTGGQNTVHMGRVVDESARVEPKTERSQSGADFSNTQAFAGQRNPRQKQQYAAFERQDAFRGAPDDGHTRMFTSPGNGGTAVKESRHPWLNGIFRFFETLEERQASDVDAAKKQALLHKKLQEHRRGLTLALVILLIFGICCTAIYELLFVVRTVEVTGSERYSAGEVISAAGISEGTNLYDFRAEEIADRITFYCPYIRTADLTRQLPTGVSLTLADDSAVYCANIFGEIVALSAGLRVLDTLSPEEVGDYILLRLPAVSEAVTGRPLVFTESRNERYIRQVLEDVNSSEMNGRVSFMDLRDDHDIVIHCDGMYALELGNSADLMMKLRMGSKSISDPMFPQNTPARINLSVVGEASVRADLRLDLTVTP